MSASEVFDVSDATQQPSGIGHGATISSGSSGGGLGAVTSMTLNLVPSNVPVMW